MITFFPRSPAFERFCASPRPALWRVFLGFPLIMLVFFSTAVAITLIGSDFFVSDAGNRFDSDWFDSFFTGRIPWAMPIILFSFIGGWIGVLIIYLWLHKIPLRAILGVADGNAARYFSAAALGAIGFSLLIWALSPLFGAGGLTRSDLSLWQWTFFLPLALPLIALQTGAEEVIFRGYLQGRLGARFRSPLIWAVIPSLLFAALHWDPGIYGEAALIVCGGITAIALIFARLTAQTGSLWAAWGAHFGLNTAWMTLVGIDGWLSGLALWHIPRDPATLMAGAWVYLCVALLSGFALFLWLDRRIRKSPPTG